MEATDKLRVSIRVSILLLALLLHHWGEMTWKVANSVSLLPLSLFKSFFKLSFLHFENVLRCNLQAHRGFWPDSHLFLWWIGESCKWGNHRAPISLYAAVRIRQELTLAFFSRLIVWNCDCKDAFAKHQFLTEFQATGRDFICFLHIRTVVNLFLVIIALLWNLNLIVDRTESWSLQVFGSGILRLTSFCFFLCILLRLLIFGRLFFPFEDSFEEINSSFHEIINISKRIVFFFSEALWGLDQNRASVKIDYVSLHNLVDIFSDIIHSGQTLQQWNQFQQLLVLGVVSPRSDGDAIAMLKRVTLRDIVDKHNVSEISP